MAISLGKRKRRPAVDQTHEGTSTAMEQEKLELLLRQHFESKFKPLQQQDLSTLKSSVVEDHNKSADDSESWAGVTDDSEPEIVDYTQHDAKSNDDSWQEKQERRYFMSSKPPSASQNSSRSAPNSKDDEADEKQMEAVNMKNDYALQRLLQESSLLKSSRTDARGTMPSAVHPSDEALGSSISLQGSERHKALDLRLQSLGAKDSLFTQKKMPLNHRFGIIEKRRTQEKNRRREARENGIVLERAVNHVKLKAKVNRRDRGAGGPSVGRMKGGTLKLSRNDLRDIQGNDDRDRRRQVRRKRT